MNDQELAIKYTDTIYATKQDVISDLRTSLIDPFWAKIVAYRNQFKKVLSLSAISKSPYYITMTNPLKDSLTSIQAKLSELAVNVSRMDTDAPERVAIRNEMYVRSLKAIAYSNGLKPSDVAIANIIGEREVSEEYKILVNYFASLKYLEKNYLQPISQDSLAETLAVMQGVDELTSFYRTKDIQTREQKAMVGRQYTSAPVSLIEYLLDNTIDFINHSTLDFIIKAFAAYYSFNAIKPFEAYNEEISIILTKKVLAPSSIESLVSIIPLEEVLIEKPELLTKGFVEAGKTRDLTYLLIEFVKRLDKAISSFSLRLEQNQLKNIRKEFIQADGEEEFNKEIGKTYAQESPVTYQPVEEKPIRKLAKQTPPPAIQTIAPAPAVRVVPAQTISSKDYDALAQDLLESDPFLRPAQAEFYVRHCTVGKFYTISQYQKATGCVYETARTSMDNLAKRGYYKRENLKNKFIYTPIPKE